MGHCAIPSVLSTERFCTQNFQSGNGNRLKNKEPVRHRLYPGVKSFLARDARGTANLTNCCCRWRRSLLLVLPLLSPIPTVNVATMSQDDITATALAESLINSEAYGC
jgi:hypothetical protein